MEEKTITLINQIAQLEVLADAIESLSAEWEIPMSISLNLNLVLEELVTNIIFYGYEDADEHKILIHLSFTANILHVRIEDDAKEFNPLLQSEPDVSAPIETREIGGLGIHFVRKIMDDMEYQRIDNTNVLKLRKKIT